MEVRPANIILQPGQQGTHGGFKVTVQRHYDGNMYEMRFPGGCACVAAEYFIPDGDAIQLGARHPGTSGKDAATIARDMLNGA